MFEQIWFLELPDSRGFNALPNGAGANEFVVDDDPETYGWQTNAKLFFQFRNENNEIMILLCKSLNSF